MSLEQVHQEESQVKGEGDLYGKRPINMRGDIKKQYNAKKEEGASGDRS